MLMTAKSLQGHYFQHLMCINSLEPPAKLVTIIFLSLMRKPEGRSLDYASQCEQFQEAGKLRLGGRLTHVTEQSLCAQISAPPQKRKIQILLQNPRR